MKGFLQGFCEGGEIGLIIGGVICIGAMYMTANLWLGLIGLCAIVGAAIVNNIRTSK